ncbi:MAG TPA: tetratricopeptide repeat protein, partial [Kofleriaceae bacterium]|nr:tetratricopeptide repeat protein [Kofleriaceae bacterium]
IYRDAALAFEDAGRAAPDFLPVLRGVRRIAMLNEQWPPVVALLAREAEVAAHPENRAAAHLMAGEIAISKLNDVRGALNQYRRLLELQPDHERAYLRATVLLEKLSDHAGLFDLLAARASATRDPEARATILRRQAELQRDHLGDPGAAVATLKQAIALHPQDVDAYLMLAPLEEQQRWWQDAADRWRRVAELTAGNETSRTARLREAEIRERELGDREAARVILEELIVDPDDREAAGCMAQLCERIGQWDRARDLYTNLAQTSKSAAERAGHLLSLSGVLQGGFSDQHGGQRAIDEAFALALGDADVVAALENRYRDVRDWRGFVAAGERAFSATRVMAPPHAALRLSMARAYAEELRRADLAAKQLAAAAELAPHDPTPLVRLGRIHLDSGRPELARPQYLRALGVDPFHPPALRGLGTALLHEGLRDAGQIFEEVAAYLDEGKLPAQPLGPRTGKGSLTPDELQAMMPRAYTNETRPVAELARLLEPFSAPLLLEATGRIPRGDELPEANGVALRCRAVAQALGVPAMRVFVDQPDGLEAQLVADDQVALSLGKELTRPGAVGLLLYEVSRQLSFVAAHATFGAFATPGELASILQAIVSEEGTEFIKDLRRRLLKAIPRRVRKDAEKIAIEQIPDLARNVAAWHAEEQRWGDRLGFLMSRDPVTVLRAIAGDDPRAIKKSARATDLMRWLSTEGCWRLYVRLSA